LTHLMRRNVLVTCITLVCGIIFFLAYRHQQATYQPELTFQEEPIAHDSLPNKAVEELVFGFSLTDHTTYEGVVKRNQTLSDLLHTYRIDPGKLHQLAQSSKTVFDVRKIGFKKKYSLILTKDSLPQVKALVYEPDKTQYVIYHLADSIHTELVKKPKESNTRAIAATIESSVYETLINANVSPIMVSKLVDMYAWQIDFFRIQNGDQFRVIFEEESIEGEVVDIPRIIGAHFFHGNRDFYAIHFDQGDGLDYFDEKGNSMRKAFLRAPLEYTRISSGYSGRRFHPVLKRYKAHLGTDYAARRGTPIHTVGDGVVEEARYHAGNGNYVKIRHNSTYSTQYLHMSKIAAGIKPGKAVKQGELIGYVGSTGLANGPHLCFRFWRNGQQVDPFSVEIPPSEPIKEENKVLFFKERDKVLAAIDTVRFAVKQPTLEAGIE